MDPKAVPGWYSTLQHQQRENNAVALNPEITTPFRLLLQHVLNGVFNFKQNI